MKTKYTITLEDNPDYLIHKTYKQKILEAVPKNKTTPAALVSKSLGFSQRRALAYLSFFEEQGWFESEMKTIKHHKSGAYSRTRVFKRL